MPSYDPDITGMQGAVQILRSDINELEKEFESWSGDNRQTGRDLRSKAARIVLSAQRLKVFVKENTIP